MLEYINKIIDAFDKAYPTGGSTKTISALDIILKVDEDCKKINAKQAVEFHHLATKTLFANKQARPDTRTAI